MSLTTIGQRCMSEREPELGLGVVASVDRSRIAIKFPATGEQRIYAFGTPVLKRVQFRVGENVTPRDGKPFAIESIEDVSGLLTYIGKGAARVREDALSDVTSVSSPPERLLAGQVDENEVFTLRHRALQMRTKLRQSEVRGFLGGRLDLIPHQYFILEEVSSRQIPRVLLADEVGLGKTIEACLILQRLLAVGKVKRALILVPEPLTHQWFVELLRRFNLWFSIYDEDRCIACEASDPGQNPFLSSQLGLTNAAFLSGNPTRAEQVLTAGWDLVIVDEAHHLEWTPEKVSPEYTLVEQLSTRSPGLLLLTATPTQLGLTGHFARLRLLDPHRYTDLEKFVEEAEGFVTVAGIAEKIIEKKKLTAKDHGMLEKIFSRDPERLAQLLAALDAAKPGAREALIKTLLDQHGTGRVMFRNTRANMSGFPKRKFCPVPLTDNNVALHARIAREFLAEETGEAGGARYAFKDDPRIAWLAQFLQADLKRKILLICKTQRKVLAIELALQEKMSAKLALFHEGLPLVQRDRNAAYFAEPEGAQLLLCSEIGSEGRNFQFAHHLVLFDLPLNPGLIEQRIGRLDRIGQTETIRVHVPYVVGSSDECVIEWYHRGLDSIETPLHGGNDYQEKFRERLLALAAAYGEGKLKGAKASDVGPDLGQAGSTSKARAKSNRLDQGRALQDAEGHLDAERRLAPEIDAFINETIAFREKLSEKMRKGRDRLLELNSFNPERAAAVIERVRAADADPALRQFLVALLDHFGVRMQEHEEGDVFLDPRHAYVEGFPSIPHDGMLASFTRKRAIAREDIVFVSADHALVRDSIDLLIDSPSGTTAFGRIISDEPNLLFEAIFVLETVADSRWHVDQFLAPTPVRILVDVKGEDLSDARGAVEIAADIEEDNIHRFLEQPRFGMGMVKRFLEAAEKHAARRCEAMKRDAQARAGGVLKAEIQRLVDLRKLNDHVRPEEIGLAQEQLKQVIDAIEQARLRLDSIRLIVEGEAER